MARVAEYTSEHMDTYIRVAMPRLFCSLVLVSMTVDFSRVYCDGNGNLSKMRCHLPGRLTFGTGEYELAVDSYNSALPKSALELDVT